MSRTNSRPPNRGVVAARTGRYGMRERVNQLDTARHSRITTAMVKVKGGHRAGSSAPLGCPAVARKNTANDSSQPAVSPIHRKNMFQLITLVRSR